MIKQSETILLRYIIIPIIISSKIVLKDIIYHYQYSIYSLLRYKEALYICSDLQHRPKYLSIVITNAMMQVVIREIPIPVIPLINQFH